MWLDENDLGFSLELLRLVKRLASHVEWQVFMKICEQNFSGGNSRKLTIRKKIFLGEETLSEIY
jgi:hypothetical protein